MYAGYPDNIFETCASAKWDHKKEDSLAHKEVKIPCRLLYAHYAMATHWGGETRDVHVKRWQSEDGCDHAVVNGNGASVKWCNSGFPPDQQDANPALDDDDWWQELVP